MSHHPDDDRFDGEAENEKDRLIFQRDLEEFTLEIQEGKDDDDSDS